MVDYGLRNKVALITGVNNPYGIGAATALAFAREGAKLVLVYKRIPRPYDEKKTDRTDCPAAGNVQRHARSGCRDRAAALRL